MSNSTDSSVKLGGSKRIETYDGISVEIKRELEELGKFDEDWSFKIYDIPEEFRTERKIKNFLLAKKEEKEQKLILESKPYHVEIEPTNVCNLHCPLCSTGIGAKTRTKGIMTFEHFKKLIDEIKDTTLQLALQDWGEPTLVKELPKMIKYASDAKIFTHLSSNFSVEYSNEFLESFIKSGLGRLVTDVDGTTQEVYELYRQNGNLELVLNNIRRAVKIKRENNLKFPFIQARMLVTKKNEHQVKEFQKIGKELGVDEIEIGKIQLNPNTAAGEWLPENRDFVYQTYQGERRTSPCHWPWSGLVINWNGGVAPCAIVDDPSSDFGNVFEDGISSIWNNNYYKSARSTWRNDVTPDVGTICNICKNDTHNKDLLRVGNSFSLTREKDIEFSKK